jgi:acyl-CoA thioesterase
MADLLDHNQAEPSDISFALDVEQLDLNLYRSRNLSLPFEARGVFGGQVISQALIAATKCVKPEFTVHVRVHYSHRVRAHLPRIEQSLHVRTLMLVRGVQ